MKELAIIVPLVVAAPVLAHDKGVANWISRDYPSCCGVNDCFRISQNDVEVLAEGVRIKATGEIIVYSNLKQSRDGSWWRCHVTYSPEVTRCLFAPGVS